MSIQPTMLASIIRVLGNSRLSEDNEGDPNTSRSVGGTDSLIQEAHRFLNEIQTPSSNVTKRLGPETSRIYSGSQETQQAAEAGDTPRRTDLSNFLATDEVPETLFGIPIVASPEQYTEADIAFFKEHPRAGGFYELGDEDADTQATEGGGDTMSFVTGLPTSDREFSRSFESKPVVKVIDGKTYYFPTIDAKGNYDIQGYRRYWSDKKKRMVPHTNSDKLPEEAFIKGRDYTDQYTDTMAGKLYARHGVDPGKLGVGAKYAAWDIAFNTGGDALVNRSKKLDNIVKTLKRKGLTAEESLTVALAIEQDTYGGRNYRRQSARGGVIMDDLAKSKNSLIQEFVQAYRTGWSGARESSTPAINEMSYGTNWAKHSAGMNSMSAIADKYKLDYTKKER